MRVTVPVRAGELAAEIAIEPAHCERLFRTAAYVAIRDGLLDPGERAVAYLRAGRVRERHASVACLDSCHVELAGTGGRTLTQVEFPRQVFLVFAVARAVHLLVAAGGREPVRGVADIAYAVHAAEADDDEPFPVAIPALPAASLTELRAVATPSGASPAGWIETFVRPQVVAGLEEIERLSRATGVEAAGRIHARVGLDPATRQFVRVLERLVISTATRATPHTVVSTAASWVDFLAAAPIDGGPRAYSSVHTHLHLEPEDGGDGVPADRVLPADERPGGKRATCISIDDLVAHYVTYPDPLSAALIVSLFPDGRELTLYGYTPRAQLAEVAGWWTIEESLHAQPDSSP